MTKTTERKTKERSPGFPFITLEAALTRAQQFQTEERRGSAPFQRAAQHWGYSPASSGLLQTIAALKQYGLLADEGSGKERKVRLTDLALRILLDIRPESGERKQNIRQAALTPPIAAETHQKWPEGLPSESTLNHYLVLERGFNQSTALKAVMILKENEQFANISTAGGLSGHNKTLTDTTFQQEPMKTVGFEMRPDNPAPIVVVRASARTERIIDPAGLDILVQFNGEPTYESYEFLRDYIDLRMKRMKKEPETKQ